MAAGNPAHHLERILTRFEDNAGGSTHVADCWNAALGFPSDFAASIAATTALVPAIRQKVISHGLDDQLRLVDRYESAWLRPFFPDDRSWTGHSADLIDNDALLALSSLSAIFGALDGVPSSVGPEDSKTLLELLDDARASVRAAIELPPALRGAILSRLLDVQWAVEHYDVRGPEGLQAALERLGAELAKTSGRTGDWRKKAGTALVFGWLLFSNADDVVADLEASATIVHELSEWKDEAGKLMAPVFPALGRGSERNGESTQLESGSATADGDDDVVDAEIVESPEDPAN